MEQTVVKAMAVLEALVHAEHPQRLTDLAHELTLTKPNVYRLLGTLAHLGYVQQDGDTGLYRPTLKVYELGSLLVGRVDLVTVARPVLHRLSEQARESTQLAVFDGGYVVYVDKVDSPQPIKAITTIGSRVPASCVSTGKALLAWLPAEATRESIALVKRFTPATKVTRRALERDFEDARRLGYAVNRGEWRADVGGIAAPVRDRLGKVVASLGVWGAEPDLLGTRREELAGFVLAAANEVSGSLGYLGAARVAEAVVGPSHRVRGRSLGAGG
jgi:DNA-binding IclR family transcriptional regulator